MKKSVIVLIVLMLCFTLLFVFTACNNKDGNLQYGVKYTLNRLDEDNPNYYVFDKNGTGEYHYKGSTDIYIIHFKYTFIDNDKSKVACYYDSTENTSTSSFSTNQRGWRKIFLVSKNVIFESMTSEYYTQYINENYWDEIPNA